MRKPQSPQSKHKSASDEISEKIEVRLRKLASLFKSKSPQVGCELCEKKPAQPAPANQPPRITRITTGQFSPKEEILWGKFLALQQKSVSQSVPEQLIRQARSDIICFYLPQASNFADLFDRYQMPHYSLTEAGDLRQAAYKGLIEAVDAYDPMRGVNFMSFARLRIRGAMLDALREMQEYPRSIAEGRRLLRNLIEPLKQKLACNPTIEDIVAEYGEQYRPMLEDKLMFSGVFNQVKQKQINGTPTGYDTDYHDADYVIDATQTRQESKIQMNLSRIEKEESILAQIPDQELRLIIRFYYFFGMTNKQVSLIIGKSVSTTVNRHKMALQFLKDKFTLETFQELIR